VNELSRAADATLLQVRERGDASRASAMYNAKQLVPPYEQPAAKAQSPG
jgi:hypothetical protein